MVWVPGERVEVVIEGNPVPMKPSRSLVHWMLVTVPVLLPKKEIDCPRSKTLLSGGANIFNEAIGLISIEIESEMADVAILLFEMAANCEVDLAAAMRAKLARNEERYSVSKARGSNKKYNEL